MIYLIDDKKRRQNDFGWTAEKFNHYSTLIKPLYTISDIVRIGDKLYDENNIVLYHESFLDFTSDKIRAVEQRKKLKDKAYSNNLLSIAFFSGSQSSRSFSDNTADLPVAIVYQNLEVLIQQYERGNGNLKYLLFGENPDIEEDLDNLLSDANKNIESEPAIIPGNNLFIRPNLRYIQNAIHGAKEVPIFIDVSDEKLSEKINEWLIHEEYDNIFIPVVFGQTLSDYNGLRLATHIRCSETPNRYVRLFLYSFVEIEYLLGNEYFNILKTKNVQLVNYSKIAFQNAVNSNFFSLKKVELTSEIIKLGLQPPKNYSDNHSVANEWAIYQWAKTIGCDETDELTKVFQIVNSNLYFKYLRTLNPILNQDIISSEKLEIKYKGNPKALLIDDEAEKGWKEIFEYFLGELNGIYTDYLGIDFKTSNSEIIIEKSIEKIFKDDIDLVILDFRLSSSDFENKSSNQVTSVKLLKQIKERNPGVQVIAFSATNKIWNFQALQDAEMDDFTFKDGGNDVNQTINSLRVKIEFCLEKAYILKPIYESFKTLEQNALMLSKEFINKIGKNLSICFELLIKSFKTPKYRNYAYLQLFLIVEDFIAEESVFESGNNCYVITPSSRYLVLSKNDPTKRNSPAKSAIKFLVANGHYHIEHSEYYRSVDTNFIISAILLFKYGLTTSGDRNWSKVYSIRNKKAAHTEVGIVEFSEITLLTKFLGYIMDETNINPVEPNRALKELSHVEQVENLKKIWEAK